MIYLSIPIPKKYQDSHFWTRPETVDIYSDIYDKAMEYKELLKKELKTFTQYHISQYTTIDISKIYEHLEIWYDKFSKKIIVGLKGTYDTYAKFAEFGNLYEQPKSTFSNVLKLMN